MSGIAMNAKCNVILLAGTGPCSSQALEIRGMSYERLLAEYDFHRFALRAQSARRLYFLICLSKSVYP